MSDPRLRLAHFVVQPVLVWDDGEEIKGGPPVEPQSLTLSELCDLGETWPTRLAELAKQAAGSPTEPPDPA